MKKGKTSAVTRRGYYDDILAGSYAEEVDKTGGFSGEHKDYVERCIRKGIEKWKSHITPSSIPLVPKCLGADHLCPHHRGGLLKL